MIKLYITESSKESILQELNNLPIYKGMRGIPYESIKDYERVLKQFSNGTVIGEDWDAGDCYFRKVDDNWFEELRSPFYELKELTTFDIAHWLAGRGNWCKKPLWLDTEETFNKIAGREHGSSNDTGTSWLIGPSDKRNRGQFPQKRDIYGF